jgi:hypothetical protein
LVTKSPNREPVSGQSSRDADGFARQFSISARSVRASRNDRTLGQRKLTGHRWDSVRLSFPWDHGAFVNPGDVSPSPIPQASCRLCFLEAASGSLTTHCCKNHSGAQEKHSLVASSRLQCYTEAVIEAGQTARTWISADAREIPPTTQERRDEQRIEKRRHRQEINRSEGH